MFRQNRIIESLKNDSYLVDSLEPKNIEQMLLDYAKLVSSDKNIHGDFVRILYNFQGDSFYSYYISENPELYDGDKWRLSFQLDWHPDHRLTISKDKKSDLILTFPTRHDYLLEVKIDKIEQRIVMRLFKFISTNFMYNKIRFKGSKLGRASSHIGIATNFYFDQSLNKILNNSTKMIKDQYIRLEKDIEFCFLKQNPDLVHDYNIHKAKNADEFTGFVWSGSVR